MLLELRKLGGPAHFALAALLSLFIIGFSGEAARAQPANSAKPDFDKSSPFHFDGAISRRTLEKYLDRAITMGYFLVPGQPEGYQFPYRDDDVRMIRNIGAKFIGRAIYRWGNESKLGDPAFLEYAKKLADTVHAADPEVVFQGCLFEQVSADINKLKIPAWVFTDFGLPVEDRTFSREAIIKREGRADKGGRRGGVPIITNLETRLWFYYAAASYINIGCEALHLGQVGLIGADDKDLKVYSEFLAKVRSYAKQHARRHLVLMDGHVPKGGMIKDGVSLLDFNSFPMRIKAVPGTWVPGKPQEAVLEVGHLDAIFKRSKGCVSPSGWSCDSLPYLVEFDNFGRGPNPNVADPKSMFCWGWDEISWFAQQPEEYRNQWLHYAHDWIKNTDPNGHLQMPGTRMLTCPNETLRSYFANTKGKTCLVGYSQEETIKRIWSAFEGEKTSWHGFDRYDYLMDEQTFAVKPSSAKTKASKGQRPCIVVVPKTAASGNPWSWQACYWDHEPQTEVELLKRGFHIAFVAPGDGAQTRESRDEVWDAWYKHLTEKHGFAKKAVFVGMSKGGVNEYDWGLANPEKVACIYADNSALWEEDFAKFSALARHDVPLLHVCGSEDFLLERYTRVIEDTYRSLGGQITVIVKDGHAHHRHSLQNPKLIADWIEQHLTPSTANKPAFVDDTYTKTYYYSLEPRRIYLKEEDSYATACGPGFTECYDRYDSPNAGKIFKKGGFSIVVPKSVAPGKPWVFTGDALQRDAIVEQALLAKGYHILIVSPLESGFTQKQWDDSYKLLVDNGFSKKPVLKGIGPKAGEAYAWAIANPDKVSAIYARNPLMKSIMAKDSKQQQPIDNLAPLAKAGVPVLHDSGALDPWLEGQTRVVEKRYQDLGGKIQVIVREGEGHFPLSPKDPKSVVDFITTYAGKGVVQQGKVPEGVEVLRDVVVGTGGGRPMRADIARPKTPPAGLMPAVLWIHGGGWTSGSHHEFQQTIQLAKHGYLVLSVEYRFADEARWPAQIEDCKLAVRWLRANAAKYQVDPERIGCWGTSAGGHLAALMGVTSDRPELEGKGGSEGYSSSVQAVVNFCGPTRFNGTAYIVPANKMAGGTFEEKTEIYKQMSPLEHVNPKAPPFLFVNGEKDTIVPLFHAEQMIDALKKVNLPAELIVVKNAVHGYVFNASKGSPPADPSPAQVDAAVIRFLDANLKK